MGRTPYPIFSGSFQNFQRIWNFFFHFFGEKANTTTRVVKGVPITQCTNAELTMMGVNFGGGVRSWKG